MQFLLLLLFRVCASTGNNCHRRLLPSHVIHGIFIAHTSIRALWSNSRVHVAALHAYADNDVNERFDASDWHTRDVGECFGHEINLFRFYCCAAPVQLTVTIYCRLVFRSYEIQLLLCWSPHTHTLHTATVTTAAAAWWRKLFLLIHSFLFGVSFAPKWSKRKAKAATTIEHNTSVILVRLMFMGIAKQRQTTICSGCLATTTQWINSQFGSLLGSRCNNIFFCRRLWDSEVGTLGPRKNCVQPKCTKLAYVPRCHHVAWTTQFFVRLLSTSNRQSSIAGRNNKWIGTLDKRRAN